MKRLFVLFTSLAIIACGPISKEDYITRYAKFMNRIVAESSDYTESNWIDCDKEFYHFSEELYMKFKPELTNSEKITLAGYKLKYSYYRGLSQSGELLKHITKNFSTIVDNVGTEISNGIEHLGREAKEVADTLGSWNQMLDHVIKQLGEAEQSAVDAYKDMIHEIEKEH